MKKLGPLKALAVAAALAAVFTTAGGTPPPAGAEGNADAAAGANAPPFDLSDPARALAGKKRFGANCAAYCHGAEGSGGRTPPFRNRKDFSAADTYKTISEGRRTTDVMPPWGKAFTPEEIWELVAYLDQLAKMPAAN